ncbi:MAG: phosphoglycerate mutase, partial [Chloroflexi bacterium]
MEPLDLLSSLTIESHKKMILLVLDGLGGMPRPEDGMTELEA